MADINDYGMKVSRQGFDAKTCSDNQLLWSSSFKSNTLLYHGCVTMTDHSQNQTLFEHNLGYVPVYFVTVGQELWDVTKLDGNCWLAMDDTGLYYFANELASNKKINYWIYNTPLTTAYTAGSVDTTDDTIGSINDDYGFKVSKAGHDVKTADVEDMVNFSGTSDLGFSVRNQTIHKIGTGTSNSGALYSVAHGLGYKPMFLFYLFSSGRGWHIAQLGYDVFIDWEAEEVVAEAKYRGYADTTYIRFRNDTGNNKSIAYVIFKDPLL